MSSRLEPPRNQDGSSLKDALLGLTALNEDTVLLDYGPVLIRKNYEQLISVHLLSGGISGTDLSYGTLVGKGMLTAAVLGDDVTPGSRLILRTIRELHEGQKSGIFVISRIGPEMFNFSLAVQRVSADCRMRVKLLSVDDNKITKNPTCGFILLIKILGAMSEEGAIYDDMWNCYRGIVRGIVSVPLNFRKFEEVRKRRKVSVTLSQEFDSVVTHVIDKKSQSSLSLHPSIPIVALINTPKCMEKSAEVSLVKQVIARLRVLGVCVSRMYQGNFVSVPSDTASLTILKLFDRKLLEFLDAPCEAIGWQRVVQFLPEVSIRNEIPGLLTQQGKEHIDVKGPKLAPKECNILIKSVQFACEALISCERQLNIIDAEKSDANVGARFKKISEHLMKRIEEKRISTDCPYAFFKKLSVMTESAMGGTLGSIYGVMFDSAANVFAELPEDEVITAETWAKALEAAETTVKECAGDEKGLRTMYFPLKVCRRRVEQCKDMEVMERFGYAVSQAEEAAQATKIPTNKYPDSGAHAVGIWMRAVYEGVKLMYSGEVVTTPGE